MTHERADVVALIRTLEEAPALQKVLLARMDQEYENYRLATQRTLESVTDLLVSAITPLDDRLSVMEQRLAALQGQHVIPLDPDHGGRLYKHRIHWGSEPQQIRETVFRELDHLREQNLEITTETIKARIPSLLRWIYGDHAIFDGIDGLRAAYLANQQSGASDQNGHAQEEAEHMVVS